MFEEIVNRPSRWRTFWPDVSDLSGAREAIRLCVWLTYLAAIHGALAAVLTALTGGDALNQVVNAAIFTILGFGVQRRWRTAAVIGAILMSLGIVGALAQGQFPGVVSPFVLVGFINGVRGTVAFRSLTRAEAPTESIS